VRKERNPIGESVGAFWQEPGAPAIDGDHDFFPTSLQFEPDPRHRPLIYGASLLN